MSLREIVADRKPKRRVETDIYTGWEYVRRYECPHGEIDTHLAGDLLPGAIMPGDSGATPEQARCVGVSTPEGGEGLAIYITATFLELDCGAAALGATTFRFLTKPSISDREHEKVKIIHGIALTSTDGGIPARAKTDVRDASNLTGSTPTVLSDYVCRDATVIAEWQGRVLIRVEYAQFKSGRALSAVVPMSDYYISRGGNSGGGYRRKYGEIDYAIPFALVETYRSMFEPATPTTLTGTFAFNDTTDVLTCGSAVFTEAMIGRLIYPTGKGAKTILAYNSTTSVDVESGGGDWSAVSDARLGVTVWPGDSGAWARRLTDFKEIAQCPGRPGFTYVKDIYSVPKPSYIVMEDPGQRAIIELEVEGQPRKILRERVSAYEVIEGDPDAYDDEDPDEGYNGKPFKYQVVSGTNVVFDPLTKVRVITADTSLGLSTIFGLVGKKNNAELTNIGSAAAYTMLLIGVEAKREYDINALWLITYLFLYDPDEFSCLVDKFITLTLQQEGWWIDPDDDTLKENGRMERVVITMLRPDRVGGTPEGRDVTRGEGDFSNLNGRAAWDS